MRTSVVFCLLLTLCSSSLQATNITASFTNFLSTFASFLTHSEALDVVLVVRKPMKASTSDLAILSNFLKNTIGSHVNSHFRLALITYNSNASLAFSTFNHHSPVSSNHKCHLFHRISSSLEHTSPDRHTNPHKALMRAAEVFEGARNTSRKVLLFITDSPHDSGPPPVSASRAVQALEGHPSHQVAIFGVAIGDASLDEVRSLSTDLPHHAVLFDSLPVLDAQQRLLFRGRLESNWALSVNDSNEGKGESFQVSCGGVWCGQENSVCLCGRDTGEFVCTCEAGFELMGLACEPCKAGHYKEALKTLVCQSCPQNTTTLSVGSSSLSQCIPLPGFSKCPAAPVVANAKSYFVSKTYDKVAPTGIDCSAVVDGGSCYYQCREGFSRIGDPYVRCHRGGVWKGRVPSCEVIECQPLSGKKLQRLEVMARYLNGSRFGSVVQVTCVKASHVVIGSSTWSCNKYGMWKVPENFQCKEVFCSKLAAPKFSKVLPEICRKSQLPLNTTCSLSCGRGFVLQNASNFTCAFNGRTFWKSSRTPYCKDIKPPVVECEPEVRVERWKIPEKGVYINITLSNANVSDNSGVYEARIEGLPRNSRFRKGATVITYTAQDASNHTSICQQTIRVIEKDIRALDCPSDQTVAINREDKRVKVEWKSPTFEYSNGTRARHRCSLRSGSLFQYGHHVVRCSALAAPTSHCEFSVNVQKPSCDLPTEAPLNGQINCKSGRGRVLLRCLLVCLPGYEVLPNTSASFECSWKGSWNVPSPWPDCYKIRKAATQDFTTSVGFKLEGGDCNMDKNKIFERLHDFMRPFLQRNIQSQGESYVVNVKEWRIDCLEDAGGGGKKRKKRRVVGTLGDGVLINEPRDVTSFKNFPETFATTQKLPAMSGHSEGGVFRHKRYSSNVLGGFDGLKRQFGELLSQIRKVLSPLMNAIGTSRSQRTRSSDVDKMSLRGVEKLEAAGTESQVSTEHKGGGGLGGESIEVPLDVEATLVVPTLKTTLSSLKTTSTTTTTKSTKSTTTTTTSTMEKNKKSSALSIESLSTTTNPMTTPTTATTEIPPTTTTAKSSKTKITITTLKSSSKESKKIEPATTKMTSPATMPTTKTATFCSTTQTTKPTTKQTFTTTTTTTTNTVTTSLWETASTTNKQQPTITSQSLPSSPFTTAPPTSHKVTLPNKAFEPSTAKPSKTSLPSLLQHTPPNSATTNPFIHPHDVMDQAPNRTQVSQLVADTSQITCVIVVEIKYLDKAMYVSSKEMDLHSERMMDTLYELEWFDQEWSIDGRSIRLLTQQIHVQKNFVHVDCSTGEQKINSACYLCVQGTYLDEDSQGCEWCPNGFYQDLPGALNCTPCLPSTTTNNPKSRSKRDCVGPCSPGHFSSTGREPCQACPAGAFQEVGGQTECLTCPQGLSTSSNASVASSACKEQCGKDQESDDGLEPCRHCSMHFYQPLRGQQHCLECPVSSEEDDRLPPSYCPRKVPCEGSGVFCHHRGACVEWLQDVQCVCDDGYEGRECGEEVDECVGVECQNGGSCEDQHASFVCRCPAQFTGLLCDEDVDECSREEACSGRGTCLNSHGSFQCLCHDGYTGSQCQQDIDDCASAPCGRGVCIDGANSFTCVCPPGLTGVLCDTTIDVCTTKPCLNGGSCEAEGSDRTCFCPINFTGLDCEAEVGYCAGNPCGLNATCLSSSTGLQCICGLSFTGTYCSQATSPSFDLVFSPNLHGGSATVAVWKRLREVSACVWMRSYDAQHYGTLWSYVPKDTVPQSPSFILYDYGSLKLKVGSSEVSVGASLNDGYWHDVCVTWRSEGGRWKVFVNGTSVAEGAELHEGGVLEEGVLILGQDEGQGVSRMRNFVGEMSGLVVYDEWKETNLVEDFNQGLSCVPREGSLVSWTAVLGGLKGDVVVRNASLCRSVDRCLSSAECALDAVCMADDGEVEIRKCQKCSKEVWDSNLECQSRQVGCTSSPCRNGGRCESKKSGRSDYICQCRDGFYGGGCEHKEDYTQCNEGLCLHGWCESISRNKVACRCMSGWTGRRCQSAYQSPCSNLSCSSPENCLATGNGTFSCVPAKPLWNQQLFKIISSIVFMATVLLIIVAISIFCCIRRRNKSRANGLVDNIPLRVNNPFYPGSSFLTQSTDTVQESYYCEPREIMPYATSEDSEKESDLEDSCSSHTKGRYNRGWSSRQNMPLPEEPEDESADCCKLNHAFRNTPPPPYYPSRVGLLKQNSMQKISIPSSSGEELKHNYENDGYEKCQLASGNCYFIPLGDEATSGAKEYIDNEEYLVPTPGGHQGNVEREDNSSFQDHSKTAE